jgi:uncharacterized protein (TIGR02217 family)
MFFECEFPRTIAFQAEGGDTFSTVVNEGFSGFEQRNRNWAQTRAEYKISLEHKSLSYYEMVRDLWLVVGGRADAFRFFDPLNCQAVNQPCAQVEESPYTGCVFQLQNSYQVGSRTYTRTISKPITSAVERFDGTYCPDTVTVFVNGVQTISGWTLDETTGLLTFSEEPAAIPTATFQFHIPVRFDTDKGKPVIEPSDVAGGNALVTWPGVDLIEVRIVPGTSGD